MGKGTRREGNLLMMIGCSGLRMATIAANLPNKRGGQRVKWQVALTKDMIFTLTPFSIVGMVQFRDGR